MARFLFSSLRVYLLLLVLLTFVPMVGLILYTAAERQRHETEEARANALWFARHAAEDQKQLIEDARQLLASVAQYPAMRRGDEAACRRLFAAVAKHHPRYANMGMAQRDGDVCCSAVPLPHPVNVANRAWFRHAVQTCDFTVSEYQIGPASGKAEIHFAYPVLTERGRLKVVLFAWLNLDWLNQFLAQAQLPPGSTLTVIDRNGTILARYPDPKKWVGRSVPEKAIVKSIPSHGEGTVIVSGVDGVERLYAFTPLVGASEGGVYLGIGIPTAVVFVEARGILIRSLAALALVGVFTLAATGFVGRVFILRRVNDLLNATRRLAGGDLSARTSLPYGQDELSQLSRAFDDMAAALQLWEIESRQAGESLRKSEELYRTLAEAAHDMIFIVNREDRIEYVNSFAARQFGRQPAEIIGKPRGELFPPDVSERQKRSLQKVFETGEPLYAENKALFPGREVWLDTWLVPLRNEAGEVNAVLGISRDITQRKRTEESLQQQLTRISLLNQITRAIAEHQDLTSIFRVVLSRLESDLSIDFGGAYLYDPQADILITMARGPKSQTLAVEMNVPEGAAIPVEQTMLRPCVDGEAVYVPDMTEGEVLMSQNLAQRGIRSAVAMPLLVENKVLGVLTTARCAVDGFSSAERDFLRQLSEHVALAVRQAQLYQDLQKAYGELQQTQQQMMQQERLRALGQMAGGIVHDINNALSPVVGFADLMLMREQDMNDDVRFALQNIKVSAEDIAHIVARMREFYRQRDAGREMLLPISLNRFVQQVIELTRPRWKDIPQERGIMVDMQTDLREHLPDVMGIESEIREALTNLVLNAVDAMPDGGTVTIRTRSVGESVGWRVGEHQPTNPPTHQLTSSPTHVVLEVCDTGIGMDEETRRHCLEPFFSTKGERGTGLGLAMVYGVMQRHDGEIEIKSELGKGTTVRLIFPVREPVGQDAILPDDEAPLSSLRVLCIDDEAQVRGVMKRMLEHDGHTVELADDGQTGLTAFRRAREQNEPFDVVITDLGMPHVSGREVAQTVKGESPTTPVIMLTGWGARMNAEGNLPAAVDAVLNKPPRMNELCEVLRKVTQ